MRRSLPVWLGLFYLAAPQLAFCLIDMYMNVLKGRELRRREEGVRRKLRDCAGKLDREGHSHEHAYRKR